MSEMTPGGERDQHIGWPEERSGGDRFAGFWIRAGAYLIDGIILYMINILMLFVFDTLGVIWVAQVVSFLLGIAYFTILTASEWQGTVGKRLVGLKVITADGEPLTVLHAFGRYWAYLLSTLTLFIGYMMVGWTDEKRALHDMVCGTRVVHARD